MDGGFLLSEGEGRQDQESGNDAHGGQSVGGDWGWEPGTGGCYRSRWIGGRGDVRSAIGMAVGGWAMPIARSDAVNPVSKPC